MSSESDFSLALTPEALIHLIKIQLPQGPVTVQGYAQKIRFWSSKGKPERCYGRLELGPASINFQVPAEGAPREGKPVILHGTLSLILPTKGEADYWRATHEVRLTGTVVGQWVPVTLEAQPSLPLEELRHDRPRIPLATFVEKEGYVGLGILYTGTAWEDFLQSAHALKDVASLERACATFVDSESFLTSLDTLLTSSSVKAIAIMRGGGGLLEEIGGSPTVIQELIDTGLPFYAALGHSRNVLLIDKFADQTFHTPSALGTELARASQASYSARMLRADNQRLNQEVNELRAALNKVPPAAPRSAPVSVPLVKDATVPWRIVAILLVVVFFVARCMR